MIKKLILTTLILIGFATAQINIGSNNSNNGGIINIPPRSELVNNTIGNVNSSTCWQGDCGGFRNPFNQNLNTTDNVQFRNITSQNVSASDRFIGRRIDTQDSVSGATFPINTFSIQNTLVSIFGVTLLRMTGGSGILNVGAIANGLYLLPDTGISSSQLTLANSTFTGNWLFDVPQTTGNLTIKAQDGVATTDLLTKAIILGNNLFSKNISLERASSFRINNSNLIETENLGVRQNTTIKGLYHDWAVASGIINATNVNITSNHQTYNLSTTLQVATTYRNNNTRPIDVFVDCEASVSSLEDGAYLIAYVDGKAFGRCGIARYAISAGETAFIDYDQLVFSVQPNSNYSLNRTELGNGILSILESWVRII